MQKDVPPGEGGDGFGGDEGNFGEGLVAGFDGEHPERLPLLDRGGHLLGELHGALCRGGEGFIDQHGRIRLQNGRDTLPRAEADRHSADRFLRLRRDEGVIRKAVIEQRLGGLKAVGAGIAVQHHGDELHAAALGGGGQAVPGGGGVARFQPRRAVVKADELVGVGQSELAVSHGVHPDRRVFFNFFMLEQLPRHERDVIGGGQVLRRIRLVVQTRAVDKVCVGHAKLRRALVHHLHEGALAAGDVLRQRRGAVVGR